MPLSLRVWSFLWSTGPKIDLSKRLWMKATPLSFVRHQDLSTQTNKTNHYNALGLNPTATEEEIREAYMKKSKEWHPDSNLEKQDEAHLKFVEVNEAYKVLSDTGRRAEYDAQFKIPQEHLYRQGPLDDKVYERIHHASRNYSWGRHKNDVVYFLVQDTVRIFLAMVFVTILHYKFSPSVKEEVARARDPLRYMVDE
ncbi:dnaJ-like chaperone JEM1 [Lingula anatina]|uniref:DnaJ-like chaperone JEM1 n=1 Tax=Lingula anatina TaxID=7574 RepID=A0A1S3IH02_LINAN|nr:dnaJ-like chaperone JEM1 [Lingula anatina]|eukprot:XP_013397497.1 dnaJ-like chaperone JEM1 [Lingula anatina]